MCCCSCMSLLKYFCLNIQVTFGQRECFCVCVCVCIFQGPLTTITPFHRPPPKKKKKKKAHTHRTSYQNKKEKKRSSETVTLSSGLSEEATPKRNGTAHQRGKSLYAQQRWDYLPHVDIARICARTGGDYVLRCGDLVMHVQIT